MLLADDTDLCVATSHVYSLTHALADEREKNFKTRIKEDSEEWESEERLALAKAVDLASGRTEHVDSAIVSFLVQTRPLAACLAQLQVKGCE